MTEQTCIICVGNWPQKDHLISDVGLTRAYLFQDQFFAGWIVLVLKQHVPELFKLSKGARSRMMEEVSRVAKTLARIFDANKMNYELLGNQIPHIHWHLIPRLKTDPDPLKPVWCVPHEPVYLRADQLAERVHYLQSTFRMISFQSD